MTSDISQRLENILEEAKDIQRKIEKLSIPPATYVGTHIGDEGFHIAEYGGTRSSITNHTIDKDKAAETILSWLKRQGKDQNLKFVAAGISGKINHEELASKLWLDLDIVPYLHYEFKKTSEETVDEIAKNVQEKFDENNLVKVNLLENNEAEIAFLTTFEEYKKTSPKKQIDDLLKLAEDFKGKRMIFISATAQGGGVALMRHALIRLFRLIDVNADWYILKERAEAFDITKRKFHNVLHAVSDPDVMLTKEDKNIYKSWTKENAEMLKTPIKHADVIVIDDPQPAGLVPIIKRWNPKAKIIYRSHIQIESHLADKEGTPQYETWKFIWENIKSNDCFVAHPVKDFIPSTVPEEKVVMMPACTDKLDGLNKELSEDQIDYYLKLFDKFILQSSQAILDRKRPYIIQIARFDPSKGIPDVIESFVKLRNRMKKEKKVIPQLLIVGNGSVDDPDGKPIYNLTMQMLSEDKYKNAARDIKAIRLRHLDQLLNTLIRKSKIVLQLSHKEGFEIKVSEALEKGKPVIAYRSGGIPLQIKDGVNGYLVKTGDTDEVAEKMYELLTNENKYKKMSKAAEEESRKDVYTVTNAIRWLYLATTLIKTGKIEGYGKSIY